MILLILYFYRERLVVLVVG